MPQTLCDIVHYKEHVVANDVGAVSCYGDVWLLDCHIVMCGDARKYADMQLLMQNHKADMVFTDPPYNVAYKGCVRDSFEKDEYHKLLNNSFGNIAKFIKNTASLYICHNAKWQRELQSVLEANNFVIRNQIVWLKNHFVLSFARYKSKHELIFYCHLQGKRDAWYGNKASHNTWQIARNHKNLFHPTDKPIALISKAMTNSSRKYDLILDSFAGGGSTLMACEKLQRRARVMEINEHYVDVMIRRWHHTTGMPSILLHTKQNIDLLGKSFAEINRIRQRVLS
ncbi:MAG: hypothetical protein COB50_03615 [Thiotrichales bacterium]|nr:MAG: hypothetical protein COB50_03615 [Thiotrichales bacterium]